MKNCTPSMMESYFEKFGWTFKSYLTSTWKTGHANEDGDYNLVVHMTDYSAKFEMSPFIGEDHVWDFWPEVLADFMELKAGIPMVKFSISEAGDLTLSSEVLLNGFNDENFCNLIGVISEISYDLRQTVHSTMINNGLHYYREPVYLS